MRGPSQLKHDFLKKWAKGLQIYSGSKKEMSIVERKKAIKLSADVAMASTRIATTCWSHALIRDASKEDEHRTVVRSILGNSCEAKKEEEASSIHAVQIRKCNKKRIRCKKILKKSCIASRVKKMANPKTGLTSSVAKRLVKKRTEILKRLVPGGESMDGFSLIKETLDYIVSLRAQVDVMRHLANATQVLNCNKKVNNGDLNG